MPWQDIGQQLAGASLSEKTLIHGDFKPGNLLFPIEAAPDDEMVVIDWQWAGVGLGVQDLVYFLNQAFAGTDVEVLVSGYHSALAEAGVEADGAMLLRQFKVAFLDYARWSFAYSMAGTTPEKVLKNEQAGVGIPHKRTFARLRWFVETTGCWLAEWEKGLLAW